MVWQDLNLSLIMFILNILGILVGVAFLTLMERKVLGYIQLRKGPNKVGFMGILQPFSDAIKLFSKEQTIPFKSNFLLYYYSPVMALGLSLSVWNVMPWGGITSFQWGFMFFLAITSAGVYTVMIAGWSSNSNYALLGSLRAIAQTISYEVSLALILIYFVILVKSFSLNSFGKYQIYIWMIGLSIPLALSYLATSMAETNRTPFDFAEGESELVSGFNVEYSAGGFALIFLAEYASILFMSAFYVLVFLGGYKLSFQFYFLLVMLSFLFLWVRGTLPRFRYDKLMYLSWKIYLPISLNFLFLSLGIVSLGEIL